MQALDASAVIYGWDHYPIDVFPGLWDWVSEQIQANEFCICEVAQKEVGDKAPECGDWLKVQDIKEDAVDGDVLAFALRLKQVLGIEEANYHAKGVGENDLLIIASAKVRNQTLITNENVQNNLPDQKAKYKIPAVCRLEEVQVVCKNWTDLVKAIGKPVG